MLVKFARYEWMLAPQLNHGEVSIITEQGQRLILVRIYRDTKTGQETQTPVDKDEVREYQAN